MEKSAGYTDSLAQGIRRPFHKHGQSEVVVPKGAADAALAEAFHRDGAVSMVLAVLPNVVELDRFLGDAEVFQRPNGLLRIFPMLAQERNADPEAEVARVAVLRQFGDKLAPKERGSKRRASASGTEHETMLLATCVQALLQPSANPFRVQECSKSLKPGDELRLEEFLEWLETNGYERAPEVYERGLYTVKGGIIDIWSAVAGIPTRIELFGDEIESLRTFRPETQRSEHEIESLVIPPLKMPPDTGCLLYELLPESSVVLWMNYGSICEEARAFESLQENVGESRFSAMLQTLSSRAKAGAIKQIFTRSQEAVLENEERPNCDCAPVKRLFAELPHVEVSGEEDFMLPDLLEQHRQGIYEAFLYEKCDVGKRFVFCFDTEGVADHVREELPPQFRYSDFYVAPLSQGFYVHENRSSCVGFVTQQDLFGTQRRVGAGARVMGRILRNGGKSASRVSKEQSLAEAIEQELQGSADASEALATRIFETLTPGDLVVHQNHGIGIFRGITETEFVGKRSEAIVIEYANRVRVMVPLSHAHLVSRYSGVGDAEVQPHVYGSKSWTKAKEAAQKNVVELAAEMIRRQARRKELPGHAYAHETPYYAEFEASFPYIETAGQRECIKRVREDMESTHPMDRLICGDAGYGKTEIALRAAFIAAMQGKQVVVLVPTLILAQQHYDNFTERFGAFPLQVAMLSGFVGGAAKKRVLEGLEKGTVDVVISTHAILSPNVKFYDLGLVIIDEEQRFGVKSKERLKVVREMVDVLTLSATPIPRTLYLGLTGARDLSLLRTPPPGRIPIETRIIEDKDDVLRDIILNEVQRGGQVFFLHNRIATIENVKLRLQRIFPHLRIGIAHGQMNVREMELTMRDFVLGRYEVLLSTTVVENGIDVPRANTIIVDRADRFGVSDLYQLRGRVGRTNIKAYAYFMIPGGDSGITSEARERLDALVAASRLGSGVSLAMRDLAIRGSGNLLGEEQSGHIAAVGFTMYCQLLRRAVAELRGETPPLLCNTNLDLRFLSQSGEESAEVAPAYLPHRYMSEDSQRILFHRRLAETSSEKELQDYREEIIDRFGALPKPMERLFRVQKLNILCAERGISRVDWRNGPLYLYRNGQPIRDHGQLPILDASRRPDEILDAILEIVMLQPVQRRSRANPLSAVFRAN